ncbi:N-acetylmuramoyl-L-alanine amidase [Brevibacillus panacihumi]|nr:N-acetylmuramoyl-L-alanine amidase [Brevibacillus panacihumi]
MMQITDCFLTNPNARPGKTIRPKGVVIHWTANKSSGANAMANRNYFNKPTTIASAHYIVDDRQIIRCLPENEMAYHVGAKSYKQDALNRLSSYPNNCTIGIEMCVNADGRFSEVYRKTVELASHILKQYGWGVDRLWRHFDVTGKNCPAFFVTNQEALACFGVTAVMAWENFKKDVQRLLTDDSLVREDALPRCAIQIELPATGALHEGVAYLPLRAVAEGAGGKVEWDPLTKGVKVNGREVTAHNVNGISYTPARELAEALDLQATWDAESKTVILHGNGKRN